MKKYKVLCLLLNVTVVALEVLPFGAVLNFMADGSESVRRTYSYFSLTPFGYANFGPFLTAVLSLVLLVVVLLGLRKKSGTSLWWSAFGLAIIATVTSLMPLVLFGFRSASLVGGVISVCLVGVLCMAFLVCKSLKR